MPLETGFVEGLNRALQALQKQRQDLEQREAFIRRALAGELTEADGNGHSVKRLSISPERLKRIRDHLDQVVEQRQVDISRETKENSGTVSVALRVLEGRGEAERGEVDHSSRVWRSTRAASSKRRETRVRPGEGVSEGRLTA